MSISNKDSSSGKAKSTSHNFHSLPFIICIRRQSSVLPFVGLYPFPKRWLWRGRLLRRRTVCTRRPRTRLLPAAVHPRPLHRYVCHDSQHYSLCEQYIHSSRVPWVLVSVCPPPPPLTTAAPGRGGAARSAIPAAPILACIPHLTALPSLAFITGQDRAQHRQPGRAPQAVPSINKRAHYHAPGGTTSARLVPAPPTALVPPCQGPMWQQERGRRKEPPRDEER